MSDMDKTVIPAGFDIDEEALGDYLIELGHDIKTNTVPLKGVMTEQEATEMDEPIRGAIRVEFLTPDEAMLPSIALEESDG